MKRTILFGLIVLGVLLAACAAPAAAPQPTAAPAQPTTAAAQPTSAAKATGEPIKIGIIAAMSGTNAVLGDWMKKGVTLAVDEKNAAGGIHGRPIQIVSYDDEADPTKSVGLAQKVATDDKVVAVWATSNSNTALADIPIFAQYKIPQLTNGTNTDITNKGSAYVFRACPAGPAYETPLVDFLVKTKGFKKFAIITDTSAYGKGEADYQEAALKADGLQALARESYGIDDKDFTGQLTRILQTNPEVLLFGGSEVASGLIAKQARQLGFKGQMAGGSAIATPKFAETAGSDVVEGVYATAPYLTNDLNDMTKAFAARYKAKWNEDAEVHGANTYDGTQMLLMAMDAAYPNETGEAIAAAFHKISGYKGLQGTFNVQSNGETIDKTQLGVWKGGKLIPYSGQ
ncbi:MAG: ABC transporter substrate-binding protein [Chloroflexi bacterium]|nr:ABC transporter substrate-binding protein [Chloroflexota bacterium]MCL5952246.1 ABC transporter substrate-binding protein [Chloroflexota bacterium]